MKYILLVYSTEDAWSPEEKVVSMAESVALCHELHARQQYLGASPLHPASTAACIRYEDGRQLVIDGPFIETHEQLAGFFLIDVPDLDAAIAIAARVPGSRRGTVEIRPLIPVDVPVFG